MTLENIITNPYFWLVFSLLFSLPFIFLWLKFLIKSFYWFNIWILLFFLIVLFVSNSKAWADFSNFPFNIVIFSVFIPILSMLFFNLDSKINFNYERNIFYSIPFWILFFIYILSFYFSVFRNAFPFDISDLILNFFDISKFSNFDFLIKFWDKSNTIFSIWFIVFLYNLFFMNIMLKIVSLFWLLFWKIALKKQSNHQQDDDFHEEDLDLN